MAPDSEITHRLGLPDSVRMLSMSSASAKMGQRKGLSRAREIMNMMFRVGKFWEAAGGYRVKYPQLGRVLK